MKQLLAVAARGALLAFAMVPKVQATPHNAFIRKAI